MTEAEARDVTTLLAWVLRSGQVSEPEAMAAAVHLASAAGDVFHEALAVPALLGLWRNGRRFYFESYDRDHSPAAGDRRLADVWIQGRGSGELYGPVAEV
jgi:hypothetical protein